MSRLNKVAVVGGSGTVGSAIVKELVGDGFEVTVLTRGRPSTDFPTGVTTKKVDYESIELLKEALTGNDAVICTLTSFAGGIQPALIDAASAVGVKRFMPSEFGTSIYGHDEKSFLKKAMTGKAKIISYLQGKAEENQNFTWTALSNGFFFDSNLRNGFLDFDAKTKSAVIYDSGNESFQTTNVSFAAKAVASILKHPRETANQYLSISSFQPTRNEVVQILEEETGTKWNITQESTPDMQRKGEESIGQGGYAGFAALLKVYAYGDGQGHTLKPGESANELLELPKEENLRETLSKWLAEN